MSTPSADPECARCGGRGWIRVEDAGAGAARPCECVRERRAPAFLEAAGIPPRYADCTIRSFRTATPSLLEARQACARYVEEFIGLEGRTDAGLLLMGPPGVGKTHLAVATLKELIGRFSLRGRFLDFTSFISRLQATFDGGSEETRRGLITPLVSADVLVFDELAAQKLTPFVQDLLYLIVNGRYARKLPTIFTTNFRLDPAPRSAAPAAGRSADEALPWDLAARPASEHDLLSNRLPPALVSRVVEMTRPLVLAAEDYRRRVQELRDSKVS